jgi:hypothetical protein
MKFECLGFKETEFYQIIKAQIIITLITILKNW